MKRKILIITNLEHSSPRIPGLVKYLDKTKWEPIILCPPLPKKFGNSFGPNKELLNSDVRIIYAGKRISPRIEKDTVIGKTRDLISKNKFFFNIFRYLYTQYVAFKYYPDRDYSWKECAIKMADKIIKKDKIDLIFSSSSPVTMHIIASKLKQKYNIPWVADFRDPWTQNHSYSFNFLRKFFEKRLEKKTMVFTDQIIVTAHLVEKILGNEYSKPVETVTNGYDPEYYNISGKLNNDCLTIRYLGKIYPKNQKTLIFLKSLKSLINDNIIDKNKIKVEFYGPVLEWLNVEISDLELRDVVKQKGIVVREESYKLQKKSDILLMFNWETNKGVPPYPTKMFEYFGARKKIIATGGSINDPIKNILNKTGAGEYSVDICQTKINIRKYYDEFILNNEIEYKGNNNEIERYSYINTTKQFEKAFEDNLKK